MKIKVICVKQFGEYPVVTRSYDLEFLKSSSVTNFSQNNAVDTENTKNQGLKLIMTCMVRYIKGVVMIKKPISPNFDNSNRFLTDYIPRNFEFTYAYVATAGA